jgi:hypothetical protein
MPVLLSILLELRLNAPLASCRTNVPQVVRALSELIDEYACAVSIPLELGFMPMAPCRTSVPPLLSES